MEETKTVSTSKVPSGKKKKLMIVAFVGLLILLIAGLLTLFGEKAYRNISVFELFGKTEVTREGTGTFDAYPSLIFQGGDQLETDFGSFSRIILDEDKYVKLEESSQLRFVETGTDKNRKTRLALDKGALTTEITKPLGMGESYEIVTPNSTLTVRGTLFRASVGYDTDGVIYTDVYVYGGIVASKRVMPDGKIVEENIEVNAGYKARIRMDMVITVYVQDPILEEDIVPIDSENREQLPDDVLVVMYEASRAGHELFLSGDEISSLVKDRDIDLSDYTSWYDNTKTADGRAIDPENPPSNGFLESSATDGNAQNIDHSAQNQTDGQTGETQPGESGQPEPPSAADTRPSASTQGQGEAIGSPLVNTENNQNDTGNDGFTSSLPDVVMPEKIPAMVDSNDALDSQESVENSSQEELSSEDSSFDETSSSETSSSETNSSETDSDEPSEESSKDEDSSSDSSDGSDDSQDSGDGSDENFGGGGGSGGGGSSGDESSGGGDSDSSSGLPVPPSPPTPPATQKTLYMEDGSIVIDADGYTQGVTRAATPFTGSYTITRRDKTTPSNNTITIAGGTHEIFFDDVSYEGETSGLRVQSGKLTIKKGKLDIINTNTSGNERIHLSAIYIDGTTSTLVCQGGSIVAEGICGVTAINHSTIEMSDSANITVKGIGNDVDKIYGDGIYVDSSTIVIKGGTIGVEGNLGGNSAGIALNNGSILQISGSTNITTKGDAGISVCSSNFTMNGGTVEAEGNLFGIDISDDSIVEIDGTTNMTATSSKRGIHVRSSRFIVSSGTVVAEGVDYGVSATNNSTVEISGSANVIASTGSSTNGAITVSSSTLTISGGTVEAEGKNSGISADNTSIMEMNGDSNITTKGITGFGICCEASTFNVNGSTVTAEGKLEGIHASSNSFIEIKGNSNISATGLNLSGIGISNSSLIINNSTMITEGKNYGINLNFNSILKICENSNVIASTIGTVGRGIHLNNSILTISDGIVVAEGANYGIDADNSSIVEINGYSNVKATGIDDYGIIIEFSTLTITNGTVTASGGTGDINLYSNYYISKSEITGGSIKANPARINGQPSSNGQLTSDGTNPVYRLKLTGCPVPYSGLTSLTLTNTATNTQYTYGMPAGYHPDDEGNLYLWLPAGSYKVRLNDSDALTQTVKVETDGSSVVDFSAPAPKNTLYLEDGDITIYSDHYTQGTTRAVETPFADTGAYTIAHRPGSTVSSSTVTIASGDHTILFDNVEINSSAVSLTIKKNASLTMKDGSLVAISSGLSGIQNEGTLNISGGTVKAEGTDYGIQSDMGAKFDITDKATVTAIGKGPDAKGVYSRGTAMVIDDSTLTAQGGAGVRLEGTLNQVGTLRVENGTIVAEGQYYGIITSEYSTIEVLYYSDISATGREPGAAGMYVDGDLLVNSGILTATGADVGISFANKSTVRISGGTVTASGGSHDVSGTASVKGGSIKADPAKIEDTLTSDGTTLVYLLKMTGCPVPYSSLTSLTLTNTATNAQYTYGMPAGYHPNDDGTLYLWLPAGSYQVRLNDDDTYTQTVEVKTNNSSLIDFDNPDNSSPLSYVTLDIENGEITILENSYIQGSNTVRTETNVDYTITQKNGGITANTITVEGGEHTVKFDNVNYEGEEAGLSVTGGKLTIDEGTLTIKTRGTGIDIRNGSMEISGGTVTTKDTKYGIHVNSSIVEISGGCVAVEGEYYGISASNTSVNISGNADVTVTTIGDSNATGIYISNSSTLTISGGRVATEGGIHGIDVSNTSTIEISGNANVTATTVRTNSIGISVNSSTFIISGGTVVAEGLVWGIYVAQTSLIEIKGDANVTATATKTPMGVGTVSDGIGINYSSTLIISGSTVAAKGGRCGIYAGKISTVEINGGSVASEGSEYYGIYADDASSVEISGGTVATSGGTNDISNTSSTFNITGGNVKLVNGTWYGAITNASDAPVYPVTLSNCPIGMESTAITDKASGAVYSYTFPSGVLADSAGEYGVWLPVGEYSISNGMLTISSVPVDATGGSGAFPSNTLALAASDALPNDDNQDDLLPPPPDDTPSGGPDPDNNGGSGSNNSSSEESQEPSDDSSLPNDESGGSNDSESSSDNSLPEEESGGSESADNGSDSTPDSNEDFSPEDNEESNSNSDIDHSSVPEQNEDAGGENGDFLSESGLSGEESESDEVVISLLINASGRLSKMVKMSGESGKQLTSLFEKMQ